MPRLYSLIFERQFKLRDLAKAPRFLFARLRRSRPNFRTRRFRAWMPSPLAKTSPRGESLASRARRDDGKSDGRRRL